MRIGFPALRLRMRPRADSDPLAIVHPSRRLHPHGLLAATTAAYVVAFLLAEPHIDDAVTILVTAPVLVTAWFWGIRAGLAASVLGIVANVLLLSITMELDVVDWFARRGGLVGFGALVVVSAAIGRLRALERERLAAGQEMQRLSWRLANVMEEQSRHIARELHDEIGQQLTGLKLQLEIGNPAAIERARDIARDLMQQVRNLSMELRPSVLDDLGLVPALKDQITRFTEVTGILVHLHVDGVGDRVDPAVEIAAYRIAQEALTNVARHADVTQAFVSAVIEGGLLRVRVEDQGRGLPGPLKFGRIQPSTSGLSGMRERARAVGGSLEIVSNPSEGTRVTATLPLVAYHPMSVRGAS